MTDEETKKIREQTIIECSKVAFHLHTKLDRGVWNWLARKQAEKWGARIAAEILHIDDGSVPPWRS
jgi:hypothetical protein